MMTNGLLLLVAACSLLLVFVPVEEPLVWAEAQAAEGLFLQRAAADGSAARSAAHHHSQQQAQHHGQRGSSAAGDTAGRRRQAQGAALYQAAGMQLLVLANIAVLHLTRTHNGGCGVTNTPTHQRSCSCATSAPPLLRYNTFAVGFQHSQALSPLPLRSLVAAPQDVLECIVGMREYDVPYHVRFAIDTGARQLTLAGILDIKGMLAPALYCSHAATKSNVRDACSNPLS
jgi:hypothetical protein